MGGPVDEIDLNERLARQLDWNLLRMFIAIVQRGGITRAAEHVHLTQSAVSQSLKRLESHLGTKLVERSARKFEVTETGQLVYAKAQEIHNQISRLGRLSSEDDRISGHIRLLFASRLKSALLDTILAGFHKRYPSVTLRVDVLPSEEIRALVRQGSASAGFCLLRGKPKGLSSALFLRQVFGLYCGKPHGLYGQTNLPAERLRNEDFITYPSDQIGGVLSPLAIYREQHVYQCRVVATSINLDEIFRLTELGIGIGILPMHVAEDYVDDGRLWRLPPYAGIGPIDIHLLWNPSTEMTDAEQAFLAFARDGLARNGGPEKPWPDRVHPR